MLFLFRLRSISDLRFVANGLLAILAVLALSAGAGAQATAPSYAFGNVNVGSTTSTTLTFTFSAATTISSVSVVTQGQTGLDFQLNTGAPGTCAAQAYPAGATCTVGVNFLPTAPGLRFGAAILYTNATTPATAAATAFLGGTGTGPFALLSAPAISTLGINQSQGTGLSIDGKGNLYLSEQNASQIDKFTYSGGTYTKSVYLGGVPAPGGTLVDGAGNFYYVTQVSGGGVYELPVGGLAASLVATLPAGMYPENNLAQDAAGNLYIPAFTTTPTTTETVYKLNAAGTRSLTGLGTLNNRFIGIALDAFGDIFLAGTSNATIYEIPAGSTTPVQLTVTVNSPQGLAFDAAGNLYVSNGGNLIKLTPASQPISGSTTFTTTTVATGISNGTLILDGSGNLYTTLTNAGGTLSKVSRSLGVLSVTANTAVGATSAETLY